MAPRKQAKYRPVLTEQQILHILKLAQKDLANTTDVTDNTASYSIIATLSAFQAKIAAKGVSAAYSVATDTPAKKEHDILESLEPTSTELQPDDYPTKRDYWEACYQKSLKSYNYENCTVREIEGANEYRYLNDLMSPEEEAAYEEAARESLKD